MKPIPNQLRKTNNADALNYLDGKSCHSDIIEPLRKCLNNYANVEIFCPRPSNYSYCCWHTNNNIFILAVGMQNIFFKLNNAIAAELQRIDINQSLEIGPNWYSLKYDSPDISKLLKEAYKLAH